MSDLLEKIAQASARKSFNSYLQRIDIPGAPSFYRSERERWTAPPRYLPKHHEAAGRVLQLAALGEIERFMLFMPPGVAKSTLASICLPPWAMALNTNSSLRPQWAEHSERARIIGTSYGTTLARRMSRRARGIARSQAHFDVFGHGVSRETGAAGEWATEEGAEMIGCGLDAGVVGNRATLALFDDPFKGRKQAESPTIRLRVRQAIEDDLMTRLVPGGCMGGIFTRYIMDDPATWFLGEDYDGESGFIEGADGKRWFVLNCPAEAEREDDPLGRSPGEFIWPERFKPEFWAPHKRVARKWSSLFQQRPAPAAGLIFKREWFAGKIVKPNELPSHMVRVSGWDFGATTEEEDADAAFSCRVKMAKHGEKIFVSHVWRGRESAGGVDSKIETTVRGDGPGVIQSMPQDPGQAGKDQGQRRARIAKKAGAQDVRISPEYGGKIYRADGYAAECEQGNVYLVEYPKGHPQHWDIDAYLNELCGFPTGKYADQVDASSRACNELLDKGTIRTASTRFA